MNRIPSQGLSGLVLQKPPRPKLRPKSCSWPSPLLLPTTWEILRGSPEAPNPRPRSRRSPQGRSLNQNPALGPRPSSPPPLGKIFRSSLGAPKTYPRAPQKLTKAPRPKLEPIAFLRPPKLHERLARGATLGTLNPKSGGLWDGRVGLVCVTLCKTHHLPPWWWWCVLLRCKDTLNPKP